MVIAEVDSRFLTWTDWNGYLKFLDAVRDTRTRVTYDRGKLELMSPGKRHERIKGVMGRLLEALLRDGGMRFLNGGSTTFRRESLDRGLEPDECYWIQHVMEAASDDEWGPLVHPPPDLAIEVDITRSSIDRMAVYAALGVPEVWRYRRDGGVTIHTLAGDAYEQVNRSPMFPYVPLSLLTEFVERGQREPTSDVVAAFETWLRIGER